MIEVDSVTHYFGRTRALDDVSFSIDANEVVGFLGLNGAGKSTMLRILGGLLHPSQGSVEIGGVDAALAPARLRANIGFLPDEPPLYRDMRVRDFLVWAAELKGRRRKQAEASLGEALRITQTQDVADAPIDSLSYGYRKRVGIAQAIMHQPQLIILDEPISGLDPVQIVEMREVVRTLGEKATVLVSSHILSEIAATCDRLLVLHEGRLVAQGTEDELGAHGRDVVELEVRGAAAAAREALAGLATFDIDSERSGVCVGTARAVDLTEGDEAVDAVDPERWREGLVAALVGAGLGVRRVQPQRAELEDIFVGLTGGDA